MIDQAHRCKIPFYSRMCPKKPPGDQLLSYRRYDCRHPDQVAWKHVAHEACHPPWIGVLKTPEVECQIINPNILDFRLRGSVGININLI